MTDADQDLRFLAHVIAKADEIREDLGSVNELFDEAAHRRLVDGESASSVQADLDKRIALAQGRASIEADDDVVATAGVSVTPRGTDGVTAGEQLAALSAELDLDADALRETLEAAMAIRAGRPQLERVGRRRQLPPAQPGPARLGGGRRRVAAAGLGRRRSRRAGARAPSRASPSTPSPSSSTSGSGSSSARARTSRSCTSRIRWCSAPPRR